MILYNRLINGEKVSKFAFCAEYECNGRSFDRDIEDIRLFLSETYSGKELIYERSENLYYLSGERRVVLEYNIIERILFDSEVLRTDELSNLLRHLASNSENTNTLIRETDRLMKTYSEPKHGKSLMKIYGDLMIVIKHRSVINMRYETENEFEYMELIPCTLFYKDNRFYLSAFNMSEKRSRPAIYKLELIDSFTVLRRATANEARKAEQYTNNYIRESSIKNKED